MASAPWISSPTGASGRRLSVPEAAQPSAPSHESMEEKSDDGEGLKHEMRTLLQDWQQEDDDDDDQDWRIEIREIFEEVLTSKLREYGFKHRRPPKQTTVERIRIECEPCGPDDSPDSPRGAAAYGSQQPASTPQTPRPDSLRRPTTLKSWSAGQVARDISTAKTRERRVSGSGSSSGGNPNGKMNAIVPSPPSPCNGSSQHLQVNRSHEPTLTTNSQFSDFSKTIERITQMTRGSHSRQERMELSRGPSDASLPSGRPECIVDAPPSQPNGSSLPFSATPVLSGVPPLARPPTGLQCPVPPPEGPPSKDFMPSQKEIDRMARSVDSAKKSMSSDEEKDLEEEENEAFGPPPPPLPVRGGFVPRAWEGSPTISSMKASTSSLARDQSSYSNSSGIKMQPKGTLAHVLRQKFDKRSVTRSLPARFATASSCQVACAALVLNPRFDWVVCVIILANAASMGVSADHLAQFQTYEDPPGLIVFEKIFFGLFLIELILRLNVHRCSFFYGTGCGWNIFDFLVVGSQFIEEILSVVGSGQNALGFTGVLRLLRLVRVIRLARILRLIRELRVLVSSISNSMKSLVWTVILMFMMIYATSLCIVQLVSERRMALKVEGGDGNGYVEELEIYFGSLPRSMLSLFEAISGGMDWDALVVPLLWEVHPLIAMVFVLYVAVSILAIMNVVTGVFVDSVLASARADKEQYLLNNARQLFTTADEEMDWETFSGLMSNPQMLEFFKSIDVDPSEAKGIFSLIDLDESGSINADEFLNGCVRLQGPSKALETAVLLQEVRNLRREVRRIEDASLTP